MQIQLPFVDITLETLGSHLRRENQVETWLACQCSPLFAFTKEVAAHHATRLEWKSIPKSSWLGLTQSRFPTRPSPSRKGKFNLRCVGHTAGATETKAWAQARNGTTVIQCHQTPSPAIFNTKSHEGNAVASSIESDQPEQPNFILKERI